MRPVTSLKDDRPTLGDEEVSLATCTAAGSRPPAEVKWVTGTLTEPVNTTTNVTQHANGTTTTVSSLFGVPTREIHHQLVQCVITSAAMSTEEILPYNIQIYCEYTNTSSHQFLMFLIILVHFIIFYHFAAQPGITRLT